MTDEQKLEMIIDHLTGYSMITRTGGYPGEALWIGKTLAYTASRGGDFSDLKNDSSLNSITKREMLKWADRVIAYCKEHDLPEEDRNEAFYETAK